MQCPRWFFSLSLAAVLVANGSTFPSAWPEEPSAEPPAPQAARPAQRAAPAKDAADRSALATVEGRTIAAWQAALKDRDPAVRLKAVEILGQRAYDLSVPETERQALQLAINGLMSDKNDEVRHAAAFYIDLQRIAKDPARVKQAIEAEKREVRPTLTPIRLVDTEGRPVAGAVASPHFHRYSAYEPRFTAEGSISSAQSDAHGELALKLEVPSHLDAAGIYALRQDPDQTLVGARRISPDEIRQGRPISVTMHRACQVRLRVECPGFRELAERYHADIGGDEWPRLAHVSLGTDRRSPRLLLASSSRGELEFLLPPGGYMLTVYGGDTDRVQRTIEVTPGHRVLSLGVLNLRPSGPIALGNFDGYWRSVRGNSDAVRKGEADGPAISYHRPRYGPPLMGETRQARSLAFSPDGKLLASGHSYNADPSEVKLWDPAKGTLLATFPLARCNDVSVTFSSDGRFLAATATGQSDPLAPEVVVWDVASRRELRRLSAGGDGWIMGTAFLPDGNTLATIGVDKAVRYWDVSTGRETAHVKGIAAGRRIAPAPDGKSLAINGASGALLLWDVMANQPRAELESASEPFLARALAWSRDGRMLAAAGSVLMPAPDARADRSSRVRLYDLARDKPVRRAELTHEVKGRVEHFPFVSDLTFTPDSRRLIGLLMSAIVVWDAATGAERDSLDRRMTSASDVLAISPDGRSLALTQPIGGGIVLLDLKAIDD